MLIVYDDLYAEHLRGIPHPEAPDRVQSIAAFLRDRGSLGNVIPARDAQRGEIERVHGASYVDLVEREIAQLQGHAGYLSTGDTVVDETSLAVARRAAGGAIVAAQTAMERKTAVFAIVRPPGHHAESTRGMGFCVFNNAAIAARAVQRSLGGPVLIVDFDYHHGNGTQAVSGQGLSYVSTHGYPAYPGTGGPQENYLLEDGDAIVNLPLPAHRFGTEAFVAAWDRLLPLVAERVKPVFIVVSAGFDYVAGDPVGDLGVEIWAAAHLAELLERIARTYCDGRLAYVLEGGYDTRALAESVGAIVDVHDARARGRGEPDTGSIPPAQQSVMSQIEALLAS